MSNGEFSPVYNSEFGTGCFRRRIRLQHRAGQVEAELEDSSHAFRIVLHYDGDIVRQIEATTRRYPLTTCSGAVEPLKAFEGQSIHASIRDLNQAVNARHNCTHLFDLNVLAMFHATRPYGSRVYDVVLPDETDSGSTLTVLQDGQTVLEWQVKDWRVLAPEALRGETLYAGFSSWWGEHCGNDSQRFEYGLLAQKGYLVSHARRYDHSVNGGKVAVAGEEMLGICYSYSKGTIERARYTRDSFRDFTDQPEQLLRCFDQTP